MDRISLEHRDGRLVVVKRAFDAEAAARLEHEYSILRSIRHPGVVHPGAWHEPDGICAAMETQLVEGAAAMSDIGDGLRPAELLELTVGLLSTLADLHESGLAHGNLTADHALVGRDDRIVLCSFGSAGPVDEASARHDTTHAALIVAGMLSRATRFPESEPSTADLLRVTSAAADGGRSLSAYLEDVETIQARALANNGPHPLRRPLTSTPANPAPLPTNRTASALDATRTWRRAHSVIDVDSGTAPTSPIIAITTVMALLVATWILTRATLGLPLVPEFVAAPEMRAPIPELEVDPSAQSEW